MSGISIKSVIIGNDNSGIRIRTRIISRISMCLKYYWYWY